MFQQFISEYRSQRTENRISKRYLHTHIHSSRRRQWQPTPVLLPGKSHGWRSLVGFSPWGREESDPTERLHFPFYFPALEKEMAAHSSVLAWRIPGMGEPGGLPSNGVAQSRTRLKRLSSSSSSIHSSITYKSRY